MNYDEKGKDSRMIWKKEESIDFASVLLLLWGAGEQGASEQCAGVGLRVGMATRAVEPLVMSPWYLSLVILQHVFFQ